MILTRKVKCRLFFNVIRFMYDDSYYNEVSLYYWYLYKKIKAILNKSKIYMFLMEEQEIEE